MEVYAATGTQMGSAEETINLSMTAKLLALCDGWTDVSAGSDVRSS